MAREDTSAKNVTAARPAPPPDPRLGTVVAGRYRLILRLGSGGMGTVYEAEQLTTRKRLAVKILQAGLGRIEIIRRRFEREALAASRLDHPNIVSVADFGVTEDNGLFLAMELVRGHSLGDVLERGRLSPRRAVLITRQILQALAHAHAAGIVHRDLKPDNVMVLDTGASEAERDHVKLLDFGIAKLIGDAELEAGGEKLTQAGVAFGTPEYMAPEQAMGEQVDARADLYALGIMLFEMLAGRRPFEASDKVALLRLQINKLPPTLAQVAPDAASSPLFETLIARTLAKKREDRYASADEMLAAFDRAALDFLAPVETNAVRAATATDIIRAGGRAAATQAGLPQVLAERRVLIAGGATLIGVLLLIGLLARARAHDKSFAPVFGEAQLMLARARAQHGDGSQAFDAYEAAVATDPALAADPQLRADVAALASRARDRELRVRARVAADAWGFGDRVDRVESFSLDLAQGATCAARREAVPKLRALKDKRAITALTRARGVEGGINRCLDRDAREAIEFLEALP
jgi:hypothetical protein